MKLPEVEAQTVAFGSPAELVAHLRVGKKCLLVAGMDLRGLDLSGLDLAGLRFYRVDLRDANLSRTQLTGAIFIHSDLSGVRLDHAELVGTMFTCMDADAEEAAGEQPAEPDDAPSAAQVDPELAAAMRVASTCSANSKRNSDALAF